MNRVAAAIEMHRTRLESRLSEGLTTAEQVQRLHRELDMEPAEFCRFQNLKSIAAFEGTLTQDEAQTIYALLGETPEHFNGQSVEAKSVLTMIFGELLERSVARAGTART